MSLFLDITYARQLNLEQFKETQRNYFNFRCPICGDSQKSKTKKRGWLIPSQDSQGLFFNCFNCSASMSMSFFIFTVDKNLLTSYNREKFEETNRLAHFNKPIEKPKIVVKNETIKNITAVSSLPEDHKAKIYLNGRKINQKYWNEIYHTDNYKKWIVDNYLPEKYQHTTKTDERLVFPLYTIRGELIGLQGRSLDPQNEIRFLTVKIKETEYSLCYNFNRISILNFIYITEGIFDALVLPNSIAMLKSNINLKFIKEHLPVQKTIFIFDNEPRNKNVVKNYESIAGIEDFGLFIWPKNIGVKDLNELAIKRNLNQTQMENFIKEHIIFGQLKKTIRLSDWKIN